MDMYEEASDEAFDTLSFSDLQIYSDPSSSFKEEQDLGNSFSSFRFKIVVGSPPPNETVFFRKLISVPHETNLKPHLNNDHKRSNDDGFGRKASHVRSGKRSSKGFLMFGSGRPTMELSDLRSRQARGSPLRIVPLNGDGNEELEEMMPRRKSRNWPRKFFGACIPTV